MTTIDRAEKLPVLTDKGVLNLSSHVTALWGRELILQGHIELELCAAITTTVRPRVTTVGEAWDMVSAPLKLDIETEQHREAFLKALDSIKTLMA